MAEDQVQESRGDRGIVGTATAALTIKQLWHEKHFKTIKEKVGKKMRKILIPLPKAPSLKQFAKLLLKDGNETAKEWFAHKAGSLNKSRSTDNLRRISEEKKAKKQSKK